MGIAIDLGSNYRYGTIEYLIEHERRFFLPFITVGILLFVIGRMWLLRVYDGFSSGRARAWFRILASALLLMGTSWVVIFLYRLLDIVINNDSPASFTPHDFLSAQSPWLLLSLLLILLSIVVFIYQKHSASEQSQLLSCQDSKTKVDHEYNHMELLDEERKKGQSYTLQITAFFLLLIAQEELMRLASDFNYPLFGLINYNTYHYRIFLYFVIAAAILFFVVGRVQLLRIHDNFSSGRVRAWFRILASTLLLLGISRFIETQRKPIIFDYWIFEYWVPRSFQDDLLDQLPSLLLILIGVVILVICHTYKAPK